MPGTQRQYQLEKAGLSPEGPGRATAPVTLYLFARPQFSLLHPETQSWSYRWFPLANPWGNIHRWCCLSEWGGTMRPLTCHCCRWGWSYRVTPKFSTGERRTGWKPWTPSGWSYISLAPPVQSAKKPEAAEAHSLDRPGTCAQQGPQAASSALTPSLSPALCPPARGKTRGGGGWQLSPQLLFLSRERLQKEGGLAPLTVGRAVSLAGDSEQDLSSQGRTVPPSQNTAQGPDSGVGVWWSAGGARRPRPPSGHTHLQQAQRGPQGQPRSMAQHRARRSPPRPSTGAGARGGPDGRRGGHLLRALSAPRGRTALPSGLATRRGRRRRCCCCCRPGRAADARGGGGRQRAALPTLPCWPALPRPGPRPRTSAIKRQFPRLPAKEQCAGEGGSPEEPTPEVAKGARGGPRCPRCPAPPPPWPGVPSAPTELCRLLLLLPPATFTFSHSVVLLPAVVATISTCSLSLSSPPPNPLPPSTPSASPSLSSFLSSSSAFSRASFPRIKLDHSRFP